LGIRKSRRERRGRNIEILDKSNRKNKNSNSIPNDTKCMPKHSKKKSKKKRKRKHIKQKRSLSSQTAVHIADEAERKDRSVSTIQNVFDESSGASIWQVSTSESRKHDRLRNRKSGLRSHSEEKWTDDENKRQGRDDPVELSLMTRRMMELPKDVNQAHSIRSTSNVKAAGIYEKLKLRTESILEEKFSNLIVGIKRATERICKGTRNYTKNDCNHLMKTVDKVIEGENQEGFAAYKEKILQNQIVLKRCRSLEKQLAKWEKQCRQLTKDARLHETLRRKHSALEGEFKNVCEHNSALQTELSQVKQKYQEQLAAKVAEITVLKEVRTSLIAKAKELREENERSQEMQRIKWDEELNNIREAHAKEISKLQAQCSKLEVSGLNLTKENKRLKKILMKNGIESSLFEKTVPATPARGILGAKSTSAESSLQIETPYSGQRLDFLGMHSLRDGSAEISMLKADIASLRVSLESRAAQLSELQKIYNIYVMLTGLFITKNELYFECVTQNPEERVTLMFSLICHDNGSAIRYEKNAWKADLKCPRFLNDCSGHFFDRKLAPLFLKNVIKAVFSTKTQACL